MQQQKLFGDEGQNLIGQARADSDGRHSFFSVGGGRDFVVFNDGELSMETVEAADLTPVEIELGSKFASAAWSCNCSWYFVVMDEGLALFNVYSNKGFLCRKKSALFIELYLGAPSGQKKKRR